MSVFPDFIVYIWLLPATVQIIFPLVMLLAWFAARGLGIMPVRNLDVSKNITPVGGKSEE